MPAQALSFRAACGCFHAVLIHILGRKAKKYAEGRMKVVRLSSRGQGCIFGFVLTLMFWGSLLLRAGDVETNPGPPKRDNVGGGMSGGGAGRGSTVQTRLSVSGPDQSYANAAGGGDNHMMVEIRKMFTDFGAQQQVQQQQSTDKVLAKMSELETNISLKFDAVNKEIEAVQTDMSVLQQENDELRSTCDALWQRVVMLEERADDQESRSKRNNLLFFGVKRDENESAQASENKVKALLREKLEINETIDFDRVHRVGNKTDAPLIARCTLYKDKLKILRSRNKLEGTTMYIKEDFPARVRYIRKMIGDLVKTNRDRGERVKIVYDHVYIENKKYILNENQDGLIESR